MLLRAARPVFVAVGAIRNCSSRGRPLKRNCNFIGLLCCRKFSSTRGVCRSNMESPSNGTALVAVCQMNSTNDVDRNLGICEDLVRKAKSRGAKVRFLCSHMRKAVLYSILGPILQPLLNPRPPALPPGSISFEKRRWNNPIFLLAKVEAICTKEAYMTLGFSFGGSALVTRTLPSPPSTIHLTRVYGEGCYSFTCHQPPFSKVHNRLHYNLLRNSFNLFYSSFNSALLVWSSLSSSYYCYYYYTLPQNCMKEFIDDCCLNYTQARVIMAWAR